MASLMKKFLFSLISVLDAKMHATDTIERMNKLDPNKTPIPS